MITSSTAKASVSEHSKDFCLVPITGFSTQGLGKPGYSGNGRLSNISRMKGSLGDDVTIVVCSEDGTEGAKALGLPMLNLPAILQQKKFRSFEKINGHLCDIHIFVGMHEISQFMRFRSKKKEILCSKQKS